MAPPVPGNYATATHHWVPGDRGFPCAQVIVDYGGLAFGVVQGSFEVLELCGGDVFHVVGHDAWDVWACFLSQFTAPLDVPLAHKLLGLDLVQRTATQAVSWPNGSGGSIWVFQSDTGPYCYGTWMTTHTWPRIMGWPAPSTFFLQLSTP